MEPKRQFDWIKYVFKIWFNRSEKSSIVDVRFGSKYASVSITLHLTFFKRTLFIESSWNFVDERFCLKKNNILSVHAKDESCNSLQDFRPATLSMVVLLWIFQKF